MSDGVVIIRRKRADIINNELNAAAAPVQSLPPASKFHFDEGFLNEARKEGRILEITLLDGTTFTGIINSFDSNTIYFLDPRQPNPILLYKHSIRLIK